MSNETIQVKNRFRFIKPKNKDIEATVNSKRIQAIEAFKECIEYATKDKENCFSKEHKLTAKSCSWILFIKHNNNVLKLGALIGDLCLSAPEFKNYYLKEVVGASFAASFVMKLHNPHAYRLSASEPDFALCKHTLHVLLGISLKNVKELLQVIALQ